MLEYIIHNKRDVKENYLEDEGDDEGKRDDKGSPLQIKKLGSLHMDSNDSKDTMASNQQSQFGGDNRGNKQDDMAPETASMMMEEGPFMVKGSYKLQYVMHYLRADIDIDELMIKE